MGCNCGGKRSGLKYQVTMSNGTDLGKYDSVAAAQKAGDDKRAADPSLTYTFKAVPA